MKRRRIFQSSIGALLALISCIGLLHADLDKEKKDAQDQKEMKGPKTKSHDELHQDIENEGKATLKEIARLMEQIQNNLNKKETGASTQESQQSVVKKIDELIEKLSKGCGNPGCSTCGKPGSGQGEQKSLQQQIQKKKDQKSGGKEQAQNEKQEQMKPDQQKSSQPKDQTKENNGKVENNRTAEGKLPPAKVGELRDLLLKSDGWGNLPKKLQEEILNSTGKDFPVEYREIISRYYRKMAELKK